MPRALASTLFAPMVRPHGSVGPRARPFSVGEP